MNGIAEAQKIDVTAENYAPVLEESHRRLVVMNFWGRYCCACREQDPAINKLAQEGGGQWLLARVALQQPPENIKLGQQHDVELWPTLIAFKEGQEIDRKVGYESEENLEQELRTWLEGLGEK